MKTYIDYQYLPKGGGRPIDDGKIVGIETGEISGTVVIPNVGDFVSIQNAEGEEYRTFSGKVRSRLFNYFMRKGETVCGINIVVEETDDDWGMLIKE